MTKTTTVVMMLASLILDSNPSVTVWLLRYSFVQTVQRILCHHENTKRGGVQSRRRCIFQMLLLFLQQHDPNTFLMISQKKQCSQACLIQVSTKETATATIVKGDHMLSIFKMDFFFGFVASYYWDDDKRKKFYNIEHDDGDKEDVLETINHYK